MVFEFPARCVPVGAMDLQPACQSGFANSANQFVTAANQCAGVAIGANGRVRTRLTSQPSAVLLHTTARPVTISQRTSEREIFTDPPALSIARDAERSRSVA